MIYYTNLYCLKYVIIVIIVYPNPLEQVNDH